MGLVWCCRRIRIFLRDEFDNPASLSGEQLYCNASNGGIGFELSTQAGEVLGLHLVHVMATTSGPLLLSISFGSVPGAHIVSGSPFTVHVIPGRVSPEHSYIVNYTKLAASRNDSAVLPTIESAAGETFSFVVQACDKFGNRRTSGGDAMHSELIAQHVRRHGTVKDESNGLYTISHSGDVAGRYSITAYMWEEQVRGSPLEALISHAALSPSHVVCTGSGFGRSVAGELTSFIIQPYDAHGNKVLKGEYEPFVDLQDMSGARVNTSYQYDNITHSFTVWYNLSKSVHHSIALAVVLHPTSSLHPVCGGTTALTVDAAAISPAQCTLGGAGLSGGVAGTALVFELISRDRFGNPLQSGRDIVQLHLVSPSGRVIRAAVQDLKNGVYDIRAVAEEAAVYQLVLRINGELIEHRHAVTIHAGDANATRSFVSTGLLSTGVVAGRPVNVTLHVKDAFNNSVDVSTSVRPTAQIVSNESQVACDVIQIGSSWIVGIAATKAGSYRLSVMLNDIHVRNSLFAFHVVPGAADAEHSTLKESLQASRPYVECTAGRAVTVSLQVLLRCIPNRRHTESPPSCGRNSCSFRFLAGSGSLWKPRRDWP
jgi:hypothetical protein